MEEDLREGLSERSGGRGMEWPEMYSLDTREQVAHNRLNGPSCQQIKWEVAGEGDWD